MAHETTTTGPVHPPTPTPTPSGRRLLEVDALRGFALGGILLVNVMTMSGLDAAGLGSAAGSGADGVAEWLVVAFAQAKFYLLFSFLFGYSFTLQIGSAERAGARFAPRMARRLLGLFVLGLLHAAFLYTGDILMIYAVFGLLLLAARRAAPAAARTAAIWVFAVAGCLLLLVGLLGLLGGPSYEAEMDAEMGAEAARLTAAYRGGFADVVGANVGAWPEYLVAAVLMGGFVVAAFLAGFAAGKREWISRATPARLRRLCVIGLCVGLPGALFMAAGVTGPLPGRWELLASAVGMITAPALSAAYASALLLWLRTRRGGRVAARLAPAGRMALTNYLSQSLVMALVFTGYGLGLYGRVGAAAVVCGALVLYGAQLALSGRLMRRYRLGPVEWVLRAVTVGGRP
ncbi:DUF418 domain-containing protein [Streptomyces spiramyceticus]|uniref:DUF418 domain-containing protein n=1 Tax=Streptomyces spiramyceticus TaxID=299717 RepID=UPI00237C37FB|nr:DUF418 domain-containing protein [Streptomyces spiramyceticus]